MVKRPHPFAAALLLSPIGMIILFVKFSQNIILHNFTSLNILERAYGSVGGFFIIVHSLYGQSCK